MRKTTIRKDTLLFIFLLPLLFYPMSPVFHAITFGTYGYLAISMLFVLYLLFNFKLKKLRYRDIDYLILLMSVILLHLVLVQINITDFRFVLICIMGYLLARLDISIIRNIIWCLSIFFVIVFFVGLFSKIIINIGVFDIEQWRVDRLNYILGNNPALARYRDGLGDFIYYMPFYLSSWQIPHQPGIELYGFEFAEYYRFSFIFAEPTQLATFIAPLVFAPYFFPEKSKLVRGVIVVSLILMLLWAFAFSGLLVVFILIPIFVILYKAIIISSPRYLKNTQLTSLIIFVTSVIGAYLLYIFRVEWITMLGANKLDQLLFYSKKINITSQLSIFGGSYNGSNVTYGMLNVLNRYGLSGFIILVYVIVKNIFKIIRKTSSVLYVAPLIAISMMLIKNPEIITLYYVLIFTFVSNEMVKLPSNNHIKAVQL